MKIFLASPGDLSNERELLKVTIPSSVTSQEGAAINIEVFGWENLNGGIGRPQALINEELRKSDYVICLFKENWGTDPGGDGFYSSGTEEELFEALIALSDSSFPMKEVWVCFMNSSSPSEELREFKKRVKASKAIMYVQAEDTEELKQKVAQKITSWGNKSKAEKRPIYVDIPTSRGHAPIKLRQQTRLAVEEIESGNQTDGLVKLRKAATVGGVNEWLVFSKYLAKSGQVKESETWIDRSIQELGESVAKKQSEAGMEAIAQKGYILKKKGDYLGAEVRIGKYLSNLDRSLEPSEALARLYDNYGLCLQFNRKFERANEAFSASLDIRTKRNDNTQIAQSHINIARLNLRKSDIAGAKRAAEKAHAVLRDTYEMGLREL